MDTSSFVNAAYHGGVVGIITVIYSMAARIVFSKTGRFRKARCRRRFKTNRYGRVCINDLNVVGYARNFTQ